MTAWRKKNMMMISMQILLFLPGAKLALLDYLGVARQRSLSCSRAFMRYSKVLL